jgi:cell division control protein 6
MASGNPSNLSLLDSNPMKSDSIIEDPAPLQTSYRPESFVDREQEKDQLQTLQDNTVRNLFLHGPRGTAKTHLLLHCIEQLPASINTCYIPCQRCSTQYQALKQIYQTVTGETTEYGHHTAKLQREIREQTTETTSVVVLDDIDFLLLNDGDSLLYKLSRTNPENLGIILTSSHTEDLSTELEERTYSSLQPRHIKFEPYNPEQTYQILVQRAQNSLKSNTVHREALTYIASTTQNISKGLTWLKTAAEESTDKITQESVKQLQEEACSNYVSQQLRYFTDHHRLLYQAIEELEQQHGSPINTGEINDKYQQLCETGSETSVSNRRLSDFLKHLELLDLINVKYHYGGQKGKTREVTLNSI